VTIETLRHVRVVIINGLWLFSLFVSSIQLDSPGPVSAVLLGIVAEQSTVAPFLYRPTVALDTMMRLDVMMGYYDAMIRMLCDVLCFVLASSILCSECSSS
jgi:hypothetical protein